MENDIPTQSEISRMSIVAMLTGSTCGEACWCAAEDVCRCSCGGKNHGIFRRGGDRPKRTSKIDGTVYELTAVGEREVYADADKVNRSVGYREVVRIDDNLTYHYWWHENDKGAPARVKPATRSQIAKWDELTAWRGLNESDLYHKKPYLLWVKVN